VVTDGAWVVGLVTLADLQRALSAEAERSETGAALVPSLLACPIGSFSAGSFSADIQGRNAVLAGGVHLRIHGRAGKAGA
jgi:hypothetical protein